MKPYQTAIKSKIEGGHDGKSLDDDHETSGRDKKVCTDNRADDWVEELLCRDD